MASQDSSSAEEQQNFYSKRNSCTRIDVFEELSPTAEAALRRFFRHLGTPQYVDEVVIPTLKLGDAQVYATVRDRPWPPWGLGARTISAVCLTHNVTPESWALSPVFVLDEEATNIGLVCALYKEVLEGLATSKTAEVCYLAAEGSILVDHVLRDSGFRRDDDVFLTEHARYFTYRIPAHELLKTLYLEDLSVPDLLAHDFKEKTLDRNALYHVSILLGARPGLTDRLVPEIIDLARGGHASKPGGVPGGTGTELGTDQFGGLLGELPYVSLGRFMGSAAQDLLQNVLKRESRFEAATVVHEGSSSPVVDERMRRASTLDQVDFIESVFVEQLKGALPGAMKRMGIEGFPIGRIELQVSASGDGDYYRMHRDADPKSTRALTFVYFFHSEPRQFFGGELRLYDHRRVEDVAHADCSQLLSPRQDMLVIFPSRAPHELLPVRVPSKKFADNRFTINGWIHRGDEC